MEKSLYTKRHEILLKALKDARVAAGLTQQAVAEQLGKPQSFVAKYENGERRLDVVEFIEVAQVLGLDGSRLLEQVKNG